MCSHYLTRIDEQFPGFELREMLPEAYPGREVPILCAGDSGPEYRVARWGLIPHWAADLKKIGTTFNARGETIHEKPMFRDAFKKTRCILTAMHFHENIYHEGTRKKRGEATIRLASGRPMNLAGIYAINRRIGDAPIVSCSMVTTSSNELIAPFHHRMPVILRDGQIAAWLDETTPIEDLRAMFVPFPAEDMEVLGAE